MKALTLTQPWAAMVAIGAKRIETRSWSTKYRGPLLIHAAAGLGPVGGKLSLVDLCHTDPFYDVLQAAGIRRATSLPFGAIVAVAELVSVIPTEILNRQGSWIIDTDTWNLTEQERAFGDYTPGRYAWLLADVQPLATPIPAKGALGLWEWQGVLP